MRLSSRFVVLWLVALSAGCPASSAPTTPSGIDSAPRIETGSLRAAAIGARVSVQGRVTRVQDDSPYGHKVWVDDGTGEAQLFIDASTELIRHTGAWRVNDVLLVAGEVAKYQSLYELLPRTASDIVVVERPDN